jgi:lysophospholipase L1-like esterase
MSGSRIGGRRTVTVLVVLPLLLAVTSWFAGPASADDHALNDEYVALGDSFAAGPLIPPQNQLDPCLRSTVNYPHKLAEALRVKTFRDVTCSSAETKHILTTPQPTYLPGQPARPIQLDAVSETTTLVTVTIGANDIGLAGTALTCLNVAPEPLGVSCKDRLTRGGVDRGREAVDAVAPRLADTLDAIHRKAPHARIVITSYANYIRPGGCYPLQPIWARDATYMQGLVNRLGEVTARVAEDHDAEYVDFIEPGRGHDGCDLTRNWVTAVVPGTTLGLVPLHPTALGEANFARILAAHLTGEGGPDGARDS